MTAPDSKQERPPSLLRDDSKYALEKLSSIITAEDYEDLGNHSTEAMGETGLFAVAQSLVMMKGLLDRCLNRESTLDRVRAKAEQTGEELGQLHKWRSNMEKKLELSEKARKELEEKTVDALTVIEKKEAEIKELKEEIRHVKEVAVKEYRDSESCLGELSESFLQGFDDSLRQIKKAYPELDFRQTSLLSIVKLAAEIFGLLLLIITLILAFRKLTTNNTGNAIQTLPEGNVASTNGVSNHDNIQLVALNLV
ncbi:uncharacterized protein LOC126704273 [Quercus robur]|uniref:uncharacterized protein LOC126704273 n=1 Tax=Quercus robur TaxID=38942 RepID=UPI0021632997|nr:uncharacterized protein LOC126704273 [Quercus robur]